MWRADKTTLLCVWLVHFSCAHDSDSYEEVDTDVTFIKSARLGVERHAYTTAPYVGLLTVLPTSTPGATGGIATATLLPRSNVANNRSYTYYALTTAHQFAFHDAEYALWDLEKPMLRFFIATGSKESPWELNTFVERIKILGGAEETPDKDIALLRLMRRFPESLVGPLPTIAGKDRPPSEAIVTLVGYGAPDCSTTMVGDEWVVTSRGGSIKSAGRLFWGDVFPVSIAPQCFHVAKEGLNTCPGDSGDPLLWLSKDGSGAQDAIQLLVSTGLPEGGSRFANPRKIAKQIRETLESWDRLSPPDLWAPLDEECETLAIESCTSVSRGFCTLHHQKGRSMRCVANLEKQAAL